MSVFKLPGSAIQANTITTTQLLTTVVTQISAGGGPKVKSLIYPGDDSAANSTGGQTVYITGSGFAANAQVLVNGSAVPSQSFISASNISFTTPALSTGTYPVYVINPEDGGTAILYPGLLISGEPTWVSSASLNSSQDELSAWSYSLSATGDTPITYALAAGNTLPTGISLAANGLISGTISSPTGNVTTYTFSVIATDAQNQDSTRQFTVTTSTGEGVLFANNVLLIHADGTNNANNHAFVDSSNNNFTITRNGNATQGSFSPFSQTGWSAYFDGTGDYLTLTANSAFDFGTGDFTIECWINTPTNSNQRDILSKFTTWATASDFRMWTDSSTKILNFAAGNNNPLSISSNAAIPENRWVHIAVARSSGTTKLYIDGVAQTSTHSGSVNIPNSATTFSIGISSAGNTPYLGYISNLRILKGTALYTANFTPSTSAFTAVSNTSLLILQSNRFIDNSTNAFTITRNGDTRIVPFSPFAPTAAYSTANVGGSGYFDGTGDYLSWSGTTFSGDLTIECWVYKTAVDSSGYTILFHNTNTAINHQFQFDGGSTPGSISLVLSGSTVIPASGTAIITNSWSHLAWVRQGSTFRAYVNGVQQGTGTSSASFNINLIGQYHFGGNDINGYISGLRMVNGTCLYPDGTTFTPPTSPPTNIANTSLLLNFTNAQIFDQTGKTILETVGDAKVSTTQYKYGTGSMYFDGDGDYLVTPGSPILSLGTGDFTVECWLYNLGYSGSQYGRGFFTIYPTAGYTDRLMLRLGNSAETNDRVNMYLAVGGTGKFGVSGTLSTAAITPNTWVHVAFVRQSGAYKLYINGTLDTTISGVTDNISNLDEVEIGRNQDGSVPNFYGYIDDFRYTKGYARYTSNFTPPTSALRDK